MEQLVSLLNLAPAKTAKPGSAPSQIHQEESQEVFQSSLDDAFHAIEIHSKGTTHINAKAIISSRQGKEQIAEEKEIHDLKNIKDIKDIVRLSSEKKLGLKSLTVEIKQEGSPDKKLLIKRDETSEKTSVKVTSDDTEKLPETNVKKSPVSIGSKIDLKELISKLDTQSESKKELPHTKEKAVAPTQSTLKTANRKIESAEQQELPTKETDLKKTADLELKKEEPKAAVTSHEKVVSKEKKPSHTVSHDVPKQALKTVLPHQETTKTDKAPDPIEETVTEPKALSKEAIPSKSEKVATVQKKEIPSHTPDEKTTPSREQNKSQLIEEETKTVQTEKNTEKTPGTVQKHTAEKSIEPHLPEEQNKTSVSDKHATPKVNTHKTPDDVTQEVKTSATTKTENKTTAITATNKNDTKTEIRQQENRSVETVETKKTDLHERPKSKTPKHDDKDEKTTSRHTVSSRPATAQPLPRHNETPPAAISRASVSDIEPEPKTRSNKKPEQKITDLAHLLNNEVKKTETKASQQPKETIKTAKQKAHVSLKSAPENTPVSNQIPDSDPQTSKHENPVVKSSVVSHMREKNSQHTSNDTTTKAEIELPEQTDSKRTLLDKQTTTLTSTQKEQLVKPAATLHSLLAAQKAESKEVKKSTSLKVENESRPIHPQTAAPAITESLPEASRELLSRIVSHNISASAATVIKRDPVQAEMIQNAKTGMETALESVTQKEPGADDTLQDVTKADDVKTETVKNRVASARTTINHFVNDMKEKIENYRAPLMKLTLDLNPKNLGSVGVTLLNRGKNLHVQIHSNNQAIQLFMQNHADFRNALGDLGYKDIQLNFSSGQGSSAGHNGGGSQGGYQEEQASRYYGADNENVNETEEMEIILPNLIYG